MLVVYINDTKRILKEVKIIRKREKFCLLLVVILDKMRKRRKNREKRRIPSVVRGAIDTTKQQQTEQKVAKKTKPNSDF